MSQKPPDIIGMMERLGKIGQKKLNAYPEHQNDRREILMNFPRIAEAFRIAMEMVKELEKRPKGPKCRECGYRLLHHQADQAQDAHSRIQSL